MGREMVCSQGNKVRANNKKIIRPGEWWERKEPRGESWGVPNFHLSPRDSLVFMSGCLVINRSWSVCLTGREDSTAGH